MKLHRTSGRPDWELVTPAQRNVWQRLAAATAGIVTPGNVITAGGLLIVIGALILLWRGQDWLAVAGLAFGRALDIADGLAADATGTKSPLGEALDAAVDKISTGLTLVVAGASGAVLWLMVGLLALPHLIIAVLVLGARTRGRKFHPSRIGKLSMAAAWLGLLGLIALHASSSPGLLFAVLAYGVSIASIAMGLSAAAGYVREVK